MIGQLWPLSALLLGSGFLLFAGGINALILPVRGTAEGFSAFSLGLLGTGWALGYVLGCILTPRTVARVGHIRAFACLAAFASISILLSLLFINPAAWIALRAVAGFSFAGAAMVVESWLSERAKPEIRGRVFGVYTMVNLGATTAGQLTIAIGHTEGFLFFVLAAIFYSMALVPTAISPTQTPRPLVRTSLNLRALWKNSPIAVVAAFLVGMSNSSFGTLAAVYASSIGLPLAAIALFSSMPILAGALSQIPVGYLSDRTDRRWVLIGVALLGITADLTFILLQPETRELNLVIAAVFGMAIFSMYPVLVAHANDHASPGTAVQVSAGLLLVMGAGSIFGPLISGVSMSFLGSYGLFYVTLVSHLVIVIFALLRIRRRRAVEHTEKTWFVAMSPTRTATPEINSLADRRHEYARQKQPPQKQQSKKQPEQPRNMDRPKS